MSSKGDAEDGICILSFDSGGPGTYSQLLILKECMNRIATDLGVSEEDVCPGDYFDLMGGVGFGGLAALILGHLRMNVNQAIDTLLDVASTIFPEDSHQVPDLDSNTSSLKTAIEGVLQRRGIRLDTQMNDPDHTTTNCKVAVYAATSARINHPQVFRTYPSRGSSLNPTIVEAICATKSFPSHFLPVKIGPRMRQQSFVGGAPGANNPTRELIKEARNIFGKNRRVAQIISIGSGIPHVLSLKSSTKQAGFNRLTNELATDCETVAQELHARLYNVPAYLRLNVDRGMETLVMDAWRELGDIDSHTGAYIAVMSVSESLDTSLENLRRRIGTVTLRQLNQSSSIKVIAKMVPAVSPHFIARAKPWMLMVHYLTASPVFRQKVFPITGMGGCGKTQMVSYFLQEHPSLYTKVIFVNASSSVSIQSDLQAWAQAAGDGHERDVWEDAIRILNNIPLNERWLLILDNADNPTLSLACFMPRNLNLTIIITSRNRNLGQLSTTHHLELGEMEEDEALATLLHGARRELPLSAEEMESARRLMKELGYLALALVQAGAYCHQLSSSHRGFSGPFTFTQYLSLFYSHRAELMKESQPSPLDNYERGVYTTLDLSYQALSQVHRDFLHFISFFHHADIPLAALATAARMQFIEKRTYLPRTESQKKVTYDLGDLLCADGKWSELRVQSTIRTLQAFSPLSATSIDNSIFLHLHPLIQAWSRDMVPSASRHYRAMAVQVVTACCRKDAFRLNRHLLAHILDILACMKAPDFHVNEQVALAEILKDHGYYRHAARLLRAALETMGNCAEQDKEKTLEVTAQLASVYSHEGRWSDAEKLKLHILEQRRRLLGMEHPDTILAAASLAATYSKQSRWSEAEKLELEVLEKRRRILGMEHTDTIWAAANMASTYRHQGRWGEAEKLEVDVLQRRRIILGLEHPDTVMAAANLASTYSSQGRFGESEQLGQEVLQQRSRILGLEHPDTIMAAANLAVTCGEQNRWKDAVDLLAPAVQLDLKVLGQQHPDTQEHIRKLATVYEKLGKHKEAEETANLLVS